MSQWLKVLAALVKDSGQFPAFTSVISQVLVTPALGV